MDIITHDTKAIPLEMPISSDNIITGMFCKKRESFLTTNSQTFPPGDFGDDAIVFECKSNIPSRISTAVALAVQSMISKKLYAVGMVLDWAAASMTGQISHTIFSTQATFKDWLQEYLFEQSIKDLEEYYTFTDKSAIKRLLRKNPILIDTLNKAPKEIYSIFKNYISFLSLVHESDNEENYEGLAIIIHTTLSIDEALLHLNIFDEKYWFDQDFQVRRLLSVMVVPQ
ncbi:MAG TPA: hypothetical protein PLX02_02665 [Syntrophorhabdaceae bacterium]|nr:hypothetical protein [Syntrophorhabdaceae bacterium]